MLSLYQEKKKLERILDMHNHKLSDKLFDIISGSTYSEAVLHKVMSSGMLTEDEMCIINAYLTGEANVCVNGYFWFKAQDLAIRLSSLGL